MELSKYLSSFLGLKVSVPFHCVLKMLVRKTIQSTEVILVVDHFSLRVFVCAEIHEVLSLFLTEFYAHCFQVSPHFFNLDIPLAFRVQQSESS